MSLALGMALAKGNSPKPREAATRHRCPWLCHVPPSVFHLHFCLDVGSRQVSFNRKRKEHRFTGDQTYSDILALSLPSDVTLGR